MEIEFAKDFWRGLSTTQFITNNHPNFQAFKFDENSDRNDSFKEMSINWNDDLESLTTLLSQKKTNTDQIQFKAGATNIKLVELKQNFCFFISNHTFSYERAPLSDNKYHGNLLMDKNLEKHDKLMIQQGLALLATKTDIIPNPNI